MTTVIGLIVIGAGGIVFTSSQQWLRLHAVRQPPFGPVSLGVSGRTEFPALNGLAVLVRAAAWKAGLSSRYAAPVEVATSSDPWRRLDRGEDPTMPDR